MTLHSSLGTSCDIAADALPSEILSDIFTMTLPSIAEMRASVDDLYSGDVKHASISIPMTISHVCRRWRQVSLSYGSLWSYLCIKYNVDYDRDRYKLVLEILDTWLQRAGRSPLNFLFHFSLRYDAEYSDAFEKRVAAILSRQGQWRDVDFDWSCWNFSPEFVGVRIEDVPLLESLSFKLTLHALDKSAFTACIKINNSPSLRYLRLHGMYNLLADSDTAEESAIQSTLGRCLLVFSWTENDRSF